MADLKRTIDIIFNGVDNTGRGVQSAIRGLDTLERSVGHVTSPLASVADTILKVDTAFGALGAVILGFSLNEAVKFQSAQLDLQKVLSDSEGSADKYSKTISDLALKFGISSTTVTQATADFRQAGFGIKDALGLVEQSLTAVKVSELDSDTAARLLIGTLNGFQAPANDAARLLDILNEVSNNNATSIGELATGMAQLSPIARQMGFSFEETAGLLTPIIEIFGSGSEAAKALRTSLLRISSDTASVQEALKKLGISQKTANGAFRSAKDILKDLMDVWPTLTDTQKSYYAQELAGINQAAKFSAALDNKIKVLKVTKEALNAAGSASRELAIRLQASEETINRFKVSLEETARSIGQKYLPEATGIVDANGELLRAFRDVVDSGGLEPLFDLLRPLLVEFEADIRKVAEVLPSAFKDVDFSKIIEAFHNLADSLSNLFDGIDLTTPEGLSKALQKVSDAIAGLINVTAGMVEGFKPFLDLLVSAADGFSGLDANTQQSVGKILGFGKALNSMLPAVQGLTEAIKGLIGAIGLLAFSNIARSAGAAGISMGSLATKIKLTSKLLGKAGLAGAVGVAAYETGRWIDLNDKLAPDWLFYKGATVGSLVADLGDKIKGVTKETYTYTQAIKDQEKEHAKQMAAIMEVKQGFEDLLRVDENSVLSAKTQKDITEKLTEAFKARGYAYDKQTGQVTKLAMAETEITMATSQHVQVIRDANGQITGYTDGLSGIATKYGEIITKTKKATETSEDFKTKMEAIASNERIKNIQAVFNFKATDAVEQTKRVQAAFNSLNTTISSTGGVLNKTMDAMNNYDKLSWSALRNIRKQADAERKIRDRAADDQHKLVKAQIDTLNAKNRRLENGEPLITITADGLEPELEAFLWKIMKRVQVRATEEASEFLLGI